MTSNKNQSAIKVVVIVGPTASGKSGLAIKLAKKFNGEVVSADSRQVYRGMNIGTGKVTKKEMAGIPHHLLDVASPKFQFSAAQYKKLAEKKVKNIVGRNRIPFIVGGTGFYIDALTRPGLMADVPPNEELRKLLAKRGQEELAEELKGVDRQTWERIDRKNPRRLIRAIEVAAALGGVPINNLQERADWEILTLGIDPGPDILKKKIEKRLLERLKQGMIAEVKKLKNSGLTWKKLDEFGLEYRHVAHFLRGQMSKEKMTSDLLSDINRYAKRQRNWFKRNKNICWVKSPTEATKLTKKFLKS